MRRWGVPLLALVLALGLVAGACNKDDGDEDAPPPGAAKLDGSPRIPDVEGMVTEAGRDGVTIGGKRYEVHERLQSFATTNLGALPVVDHIGQFSQAGLEGKTVVWLGSVGVPLPDTDGQTVYATGRVKSAQNGRLVFDRGLVLRLGDGVTLPSNVQGTVRAEIDPVAGTVKRIAIP